MQDFLFSVAFLLLTNIGLNHIINTVYSRIMANYFMP